MALLMLLFKLRNIKRLEEKMLRLKKKKLFRLCRKVVVNKNN